MLSVMSALPILCYHNVALAPPEARFKLLYVSPDKFERQLWTLRRLGLRGVSMGEGIARLRNGSARGCVAFTFDDGCADTLTAAAPLMKRYGFGATSYIVSGALGTYNRWDAQYLQETKPLMSRQLSWPVTVIGLIGLAAGALGNDWRQRWLIAVGAVPMLGVGLLAAFWFPAICYSPYRRSSSPPHPAGEGLRCVQGASVTPFNSEFWRSASGSWAANPR